VTATIAVRKAAAEDLEELLRIQRESSPAAADWSAGALLDALDGCLVAEMRGGVAGFLLHRDVAPEEREILNLAVDPAMRRQGVASRLIREFLRCADNSVFLEVRESNHAARALYAAWGFAEAGLRRGYYHRPVENAIVMKRARKNLVQANEG
jgi:[ribosomal protein S18]-alanine N-acetyltransferase